MPMKDCLSAPAVASALCKGLAKGLGRGWRVVPLAMADGGEGTVEAFLSGGGFKPRTAKVHDALGRPRRATFAHCPATGSAVVEMASATGLWHLSESERDPLRTTTFGVGELLLAAKKLGVTRIFVGLGGSATVDGGLGMAQALGYTLFVGNGRPRAVDGFATGATLGNLGAITPPQPHPLANIEVVGLADVTNPLTGPQGAARVFGPQKGASPAVVRRLEKGLVRLEPLLMEHSSLKKDLPGGGAAGGLGAGLVAFCRGRLARGGEEIARLLKLQEQVAASDLVVGAEGRLDGQTAAGKGLGTTARLCKRHGVPFIAVAGHLGEGFEALRRQGLTSAFALQEGPVSVAESITHAPVLLQRRAEEIGRLARRLL